MSIRSANRGAAIAVAIIVAITPVLQALPLAQAKAAAPAKPVANIGWPRTYATPSQGRAIVYEPQIASWAGQKQLVAYAAASYQVKGAATAKPALGTIKLEADTSVSLGERLVHFANLRITEANFSTLPKEELREVVAEITKAIPEEDRVIALDSVLAFVDKSTIVPKDVPGLKADPPAIFFSQSAAVVVNFDGEPIWSPIEKNDLKFAVNTNWDLFEHAPTKTYYLRYNTSWLKATDLKGAWTAAGKLPDSFKALPTDENFKEVKAALPGKNLSASQRPAVHVSFVPAELILLRGPASYLLVPGARELLWVQNTDSDVFRMGKTGPVYYLVTGRWFSAPDFTGPWTFATTKLPEDFKRIPEEHERSRVLASVPGTDQAIEAVMLSQIPQTARVDRTKIQAPAVAYQGAPQFAAIEGTSLQRAVNTDQDIILSGATYYYCSQGVWFVGKSANGPWAVATTIPAEVYKIPASSPVHHVTYVVIEEDDDANDSWTTFAYVAGYTGLMIGWGCAVWGSGWYYPPYVYYGGLYPIYYPHFPTYGYSAWYNPWTGSYGRSAVAYGPYGGVGAGARYNPRTGTYARGAVAWGPYGASGFAEAYNPRTGAYGQTRQGANAYGSWGSSAVVRGDDWATTNRYTSNITGNTTRVTRTDEGAAVSRRNPGQGGGFVAAGDDGNVYAGHDGNVYKHDGDGWQKHENGEWGSVNRPTPQSASAGTYGQLERDRAARATGTQRTSAYSGVKSSGGRGSGSYRGAGASGGNSRRR